MPPPSLALQHAQTCRQQRSHKKVVYDAGKDEQGSGDADPPHAGCLQASYMLASVQFRHKPPNVGGADALSTRLVASFVTVLFFVDVFSIGVYVCLHQRSTACLGTIVGRQQRGSTCRNLTFGTARRQAHACHARCFAQMAFLRTCPSLKTVIQQVNSAFILMQDDFSARELLANLPDPLCAVVNISIEGQGGDRPLTC